MAGDMHVDEGQFKGFARYFNTVTDFGRRNIAATTLGTCALIALYFKLKPKAKAPTPAAPAKQ